MATEAQISGCYAPELVNNPSGDLFGPYATCAKQSLASPVHLSLKRRIFGVELIHLRLFYSQLASWFANTSNYREGTSIANAAITRVHHFAAPFVPYELKLALIFFGDSLLFENFDRRHYHADWMAATYRIPRLS